jgi:RNA polymerase sigma-70 factor (ECF subfamily)
MRDTNPHTNSTGTTPAEDYAQLARIVRRIQQAKTSADKEAAFTRFYHDRYNFAYHLALGMLADPNAAEDVAQQAFLQAYTHIDTLNDPQSATKWFATIVRNAATNQLRANARQPQTLDYDLEQHQATTTATAPLSSDALLETNRHYLPEELAQSAEVQRIVFNLIEQLPAKQREAIMLYYYAELSVSEIAATLDIAAAKVSTRLFYGREALGARMQEIQRTQGITLYAATALPLAGLLKAHAASATIATPPIPLWKTKSIQGSASTQATPAKLAKLASTTTGKVAIGLAAAALAVSAISALTTPPRITTGGGGIF